MYTEENGIKKLSDLDKLRSAPKLTKKQYKILLNEAINIINKSEWLTVGIMTATLKEGISAIRRIEKMFNLKEMKLITSPNNVGPIYLKANQKTGEIHARIEYGLGEGILISCQNHDNSFNTKTIGPFPLDFFN
tara:strand:+ start:58 stop:459 length:402 start_codon:yes stop_codon:yes gene_type:complete